jgi:signal transduction histidine kinase
MRVLLSPVKGREDDPFQIILDLEASGLARSDIQHIGGEVTPFDAPESADYLIIAAVEPNGSCEIVYERRLMADRDRTDLEVVLNIPDVRTAFPEDERNEEITLPLPSGPLHFELRVWDRDAEVLQHKLETDVRYEGLKVRGLRSLLKDAAGVALYRDGFRVRPYGDPGYDWLGLGTRRVDNPTARLGTDQVYGLIDISILENPGLEDKSSREGLEENLAYLTLRQSVLAVLGRVEPLRYQFRKRNNLGRPATRSTDSLATERRDAFTQLRAQIDRVVPEGSTRKVVSSLLLKAEAASEAEHERLAEQAAVMHDMHALGILARFVLHEGRNMQSAFHSALRNMERAVERAIPDPKELRIAPTQRPAFESGLRSSRDVQKRFEHLLNDLDPLTRVRRGKRGTVDLKEVLNRVMSILGPSMQNAGVECIATGVEGTVRAWEQDVMYALYNLLDNALYWVQQNEGKKRITVSVHPAPEPTDAGDPPRVWIDVEDSGPGVPERSADSVFDLNYSEKPDGLGMGLFIASESAGRSHGRLELINPGEPGAIFRLSLEGVKSNA